jgi:multisubunit Na+/H+ antiporter MnhG subunit
MTVGVYGAIWMPDTYTKLHSMKRGPLPRRGLLVRLLGGHGRARDNPPGGPDSSFLARPHPVSAFVVARAAFLRGEKMETPDVLDESGKDLPEAPGR